MALRLGNVCTKIGSGATPRGGSDVYLPSGVALIRSQNIYNDGFHRDGLAYIGEVHAAELAGVEIQAGDILLNITGDSVARCCRAPADVLPARVNQHVAIIRPDPDTLDSRYLHYYLISPAKQAEMLSMAGGGGTRNALTKGMIEAFEVPAPGIDEQRAIASVLGALDDKIEQNRRTSAALERLARVMFRAWFVDFEPVKAKAAGATSFPSMPQPVFDALPTRLVDSLLGPLPEGWKVGKVGDAATLSKAQVKPQEHPEELFEHYSIPAYDDGKRQALEAGSAIKSNKFVVQERCVLLSKLNPRIARIWLPPEADSRRQIASTEFLITCPRDGWDRNYLYCLFQQAEFRDDLAQAASGTSNSHQRVRPDDFFSKAIVVPSRSLRSAFQEVLEPMMSLAAALHAESGTLARTRDYLLPELLSGEVACVS